MLNVDVLTKMQLQNKAESYFNKISFCYIIYVQWISCFLILFFCYIIRDILILIILQQNFHVPVSCIFWLAEQLFQIIEVEDQGWWLLVNFD